MTLSKLQMEIRRLMEMGNGKKTIFIRTAGLATDDFEIVKEGDSIFLQETISPPVTL